MAKKKNKIRFYEGTHTYWVDKKKLKSVTQTVNQIFPEFNAKEISRKIAKGFKYRNWQKEKREETVTDLEKKKGTMKYWRNKWKESADHGTRVHKMIEEYINLLDPGFVMDKHVKTKLDAEKFKSFVKWYRKNIPTFNEPLLLSEVLVYNEKLGYAGTIDLIIVDKEGKMTIIDWKTNDSLTPSRVEPLKAPFEHLDSSKLCRYALQLSFYNYLKEREGSLVDKLVVVHLTPTDYQQYELKYLKDEIKQLIEVDKNDKTKEIKDSHK